MAEMSRAEKLARGRHPSGMNPKANEQKAKQLREQGRCGSLASGGVFVCTLLSHTPDTNHQQQELGGVDDGLVYAEWEW